MYLIVSYWSDAAVVPLLRAPMRSSCNSWWVCCLHAGVYAGKAIAPIYEELSKKYPQVKFLKVDIDNQDLQEIVNDHGITGVVSRTAGPAQQHTACHCQPLLCSKLVLVEPLSGSFAICRRERLLPAFRYWRYFAVLLNAFGMPCCCFLCRAANLHHVQGSTQGGELHWCQGRPAAVCAAEACQLKAAVARLVWCQAAMAVAQNQTSPVLCGFRLLYVKLLVWCVHVLEWSSSALCNCRSCRQVDVSTVAAWLQGVVKQRLEGVQQP